MLRRFDWRPCRGQRTRGDCGSSQWRSATTGGRDDTATIAAIARGPAATGALGPLRGSAAQSYRRRGAGPGRRAGRPAAIRALPVAIGARRAARGIARRSAGRALDAGADAGADAAGDEDRAGTPGPASQRIGTPAGEAVDRSIARDHAGVEGSRRLADGGPAPDG